MKLDLLTNATVVDDAIRFVSSNKSKDSLRSSGDNDEDDKEKSKEPDYDEDRDQLEEKGKKVLQRLVISYLSDYVTIVWNS